MTAPVNATPRRPAGKTLLLIALVTLAALLIVFRAALTDLLTAWGTEEYSHGPFIPVMAALVGWHLLAAAKPALRSSWWGLGWLLAAGLLQIIAQLSAFGMAAQYGLVIALTGLSLAVTGRRATRAIAPALVYLIFAIPLPHLLQADLSQRLQLLSSSLGVWPLDFLGIPVLQEGNVIDLGGFKLQVVEACSGLRYLFPLMSFGYLVALLLDDAFWKRALIVLSTIPFSIGLNALRIAMIGITVDRWGQQMAAGFIHVFEGWAVFLVCLLILLAETAALRRIGRSGARSGRFHYDYLGFAQGPYFSARLGTLRPAWAALILTLALMVFSGSGRLTQRPEIVPPHLPLTGFPLRLADWQGKADRLPADVLAALQLSDYWLADYQKVSTSPPPTGLAAGTAPTAAAVNFYIAYYDSQRVGTTTHSPSNCIPGGGWRIEQSTVRHIQLADGTSLAVTRLLIRKGGQAELAWYWFDERGRDVVETTYAKWYLLLDSITMHRSDGALVRLATPLGPGEDAAAGDARLQEFLQLAYPALAGFIPGAGPYQVSALTKF